MSNPKSKPTRPRAIKALSVHVSRLGEALKSRGLRLKDSEVLEIAAHAFGLRDGNALAAAQKAGALDLPQPTVAERIRLTTGERLVVLSHPTQTGLFAVPRELLEGTALTRIATAPDGRMMDLSVLPVDEDWGWTPIVSEGHIELPILVATINHRHGHDTCVALTQADLDRQVAKYCRDSWHEVEIPGDPDPDTMSDDDVITAYFRAQSDESSEYLDTGVNTTHVTLAEVQAVVAEAAKRPPETAPAPIRPDTPADPLSAWRAAVAAGTTEDGYEDWRAKQPKPRTPLSPDGTRQFLIDDAELAVLRAVARHAHDRPGDLGTHYPGHRWALIIAHLEAANRRLAANAPFGNVVISLGAAEADAVQAALGGYAIAVKTMTPAQAGTAWGQLYCIEHLTQRFAGDEPVVYLTNGSCEAAHGDAHLFAGLGLKAGEYDGAFDTLTDDERRWIYEDEFSHGKTTVSMAYTGLYRGQKYLMPVIQTFHDPEDDASSIAGARHIEREIMPALASRIAALGGILRFEEDDEDDRHTLQVLLPFAAAAGCTGYAEWRARFQALLTEDPATSPAREADPVTFRYRDAVTGQILSNAHGHLPAVGTEAVVYDAAGRRLGGRVIGFAGTSEGTCAEFRVEIRDGDEPAPGPLPLYAGETGLDAYMGVAEAQMLKPGDRVISLAGGCGDVEAEDEEESVHDFVERTYAPGDWLTVDLVERNPMPQGLTIHVSSENGVSNVFDEADYNGVFPFLRPVR